jgi:hypothetical protein
MPFADPTFTINPHLDPHHLAPHPMSGEGCPHHPNRYSTQTASNNSWHVEQTRVPSTTWNAGDVQGSTTGVLVDTNNVCAQSWRSDLVGSQLADLFPVQDELIDENTYQVKTPTQIPRIAQGVGSTTQLGFDPVINHQSLSTDFFEYDFSLPAGFSFTDSPNH